LGALGLGVGAYYATPYLMPSGYGGYGYGDTIQYGGSTYIVGNDGNMYMQNPNYVDDSDTVVDESIGTAVTVYAIPVGFDTTPGTVVEYGGATYTVNPDGTTMSPIVVEEATTDVPVYAIPAGYDTTPGTVIEYGGAVYTVNPDGTTMSP